jgi:hypothetical protein
MRHCEGNFSLIYRTLDGCCGMGIAYDVGLGEDFEESDYAKLDACINELARRERHCRVVMTSVVPHKRQASLHASRWSGLSIQHDTHIIYNLSKLGWQLSEEVTNRKTGNPIVLMYKDM